MRSGGTAGADVKGAASGQSRNGLSIIFFIKNGYSVTHGWQRCVIEIETSK